MLTTYATQQDTQKDLISGIIGDLIMVLKNGGCSYQTIAKASQLILPFGKSHIFKRFNDFVESMEYLPPEIQGKIIILCFDEQYLKIRGKWRYRLTLLDWQTRLPIAEKVVSKLTNQTIIDFFRSNFDPSPYEKIYIVSDLKSGYKEIFKVLFGNKLIHQLCLFHLFQLIMNEFPKLSSFFEMLQQYRLFNIFYDYEMEVSHLEK